MKTYYRILFYGHYIQSEAYLEGMKTWYAASALINIDIASEAYLEGMKTYIHISPLSMPV